MLDWLKNRTDAARATLSAEVSKLRNRSFMEATVSACALVASADGSIDPEEKAKMSGFVSRSEELKHFSAEQVRTVFTKAADNLEFDFSLGKAEILRTVAKIGSDPAAARLLVRVTCAIGASDGDFDDDEKAIVREICAELKLSPQEFDL